MPDPLPEVRGPGVSDHQALLPAGRGVTPMPNNLSRRQIALLVGQVLFAEQLGLVQHLRFK